MMMRKREHGSARERERGSFVFMALIVLVVIMLAAGGLMKTVGSSVFLSGNLAFRQSATYGADAGVEGARNWLIARVGRTGSDVGVGYLSSAGGVFNPGTHNWANSFAVTGGLPATAVADSAGNTTLMVIHRLCNLPNTLFAVNDIITGQRCATGESLGNPMSTGTAMHYGNGHLTANSLRYFRVTIRVVGPRSTVSFVQATISVGDAELL